MITWYLGAYYLFTDWFPMRERQIFDSTAMLWSVLAGLVLTGLISSLVGIGKGTLIQDFDYFLHQLLRERSLTSRSSSSSSRRRPTSHVGRADEPR